MAVDRKGKHTNLADTFADVIMRRIREEIDHRGTRVYQGYVGDTTANGVNVFIEGNWIEVIWKQAGLTITDGETVVLITSPSLPLTILCKQEKTT